MAEAVNIEDLAKRVARLEERTDKHEGALRESGHFREEPDEAAVGGGVGAGEASGGDNPAAA